MRVKHNYLLRDVGDQHLVVPVGEETRSFHGFVRLNDTGAYLWGLLGQDMTAEELSQALERRYGVDGARASKDVDAFLAQVSRFLDA
ncbi:MAG: PqqD family protein [Olsenella sp.]|jgi:DNA-binding GntR family transcriptional regulator|nr:PqqD family protein [Olsenella sp.]